MTIAFALIEASAVSWLPSKPGVWPTSPFRQVQAMVSRLLASLARKKPSQNPTRKSSSEAKSKGGCLYSFCQ